MGIEILKGKFIKEDVTDKEPNTPNFAKSLNAKYAGRIRGSVRLSSGRYYTNEEWEKRREELINISLPQWYFIGYEIVSNIQKALTSAFYYI